MINTDYLNMLYLLIEKNRDFVILDILATRTVTLIIEIIHSTLKNHLLKYLITTFEGNSK